MGNREKLFKALEKMSNEDLAETVDFYCNQCPAGKYCEEKNENTCQEAMLNWLNKESDN